MNQSCAREKQDAVTSLARDGGGACRSAVPVSAGAAEGVRGGALQLASKIVRGGTRELEVADLFGKLGGFGREGLAGGRRFLGHRGVLLGHLIHLVDGNVDP